MAYENTFVLLKPDALARDLVVPILTIFSENNFEIIASVTKKPDTSFIQKHLDYDPHYTQIIGQKVLHLCDVKHLDPTRPFTSSDPLVIGASLKEWMTDYLTSGDTMAWVIKGEKAITRMRRLIGATFPADAAKGTIRNRFGTDSFEICMQEKRVPYNIVHAADSKKEAAHQIALWFPALELTP